MGTSEFKGTPKEWEELVKSNKLTWIACVCHEANKVWCESNGDFTQKHWKDAEQWQRESALNGVIFRLAHPDSGHDAQHNSWMKEKIEDGWVYGEVKDAEKKTHPCIVPFDELPEFQKKKYALFCAIVDVLIDKPQEEVEHINLINVGPQLSVQSITGINLSTNSTSNVSINTWSVPKRIDILEFNDRIEIIYKQRNTIQNFSGKVEERVFKVIYSCVDGKWNKSEPIFGNIIPSTEEQYEF